MIVTLGTLNAHAHKHLRHIFGDLRLEVYDSAGKRLTSFPGSKRRGVNRVEWPMRLAPPKVPPATNLVPQPFSFVGPRVPEGEYTVKLIKDGKVYRIGRIYESAMPKFGERAFTLRIPGSPTGGPFGTNKLIYNDEYLSTEIGQTGTQFDGLAHIGIQMGKDGDKTEMRYYNGVTDQEMNSAYGMKKLGIEQVKPFFTRGHLFDVEAVFLLPWAVVFRDLGNAPLRFLLEKDPGDDVVLGVASKFHIAFATGHLEQPLVMPLHIAEFALDDLIIDLLATSLAQPHGSVA